MRLTHLFVVVDPTPTSELTDVLMPMTVPSFAEWAAAVGGHRGPGQVVSNVEVYTSHEEALVDARRRLFARDERASAHA